jgi:hypothetical protein
MADRHELEQAFIAESRVFVGLFGNTYRAHVKWAREVMPPEAAELYIESWWQGRQTALRYLRWMAQRLREDAGTDAVAWLDRFTNTSSAVLRQMQDHSNSQQP